MPRRPPLFRHGLDAVARNSGIISLPFPPFLNNPYIYIYIFIYATKMDRNFERGRHLCRGGAVQGQISKLLRAELSTINRGRGGGKRLVWIGIGLELEPRRVFQRELNGVFFRCDSSRANEESRGGGEEGMMRSLRNGRNFGVRSDDFKIGVGKIMETRFVNGFEFFGETRSFLFFFLVFLESNRRGRSILS